jgi:isopenicillin N synthase-like dioxygenase
MEIFRWQKRFRCERFSAWESSNWTGREQIFNPDDTLVLRQDGKFERAATMKLHQSIKESYELGREPSLNQFPEEWPKFKEFWETFYVTCNNLYLQALSALALGFGLPEKFFEPLCNNGDNTLKTMHYPPVPKDLKGVRMMAHTDLEIVTLLFARFRGRIGVEE